MIYLKRTTLIFSLFAFLFTACTKEEITKAPSGDSIYSNSFEKSKDLINVEGYFSLTSDTPKNGGDSALIVSGGCIVPHLYFDLGPFDEEVELSFGIWGKSEQDQSGSVQLYRINDPSNRLLVTVEENAWNYYETEETLVVPLNEEIRVEFISGGIIPMVTYFDLLEIKKL